MGEFQFLAEESAILLYAGALGLELGLIYDFFRAVRWVWRCGFMLRACMDLIFWGITGVRTFHIMHTYSNGTFRWFAVLGIMLVLGIYMKAFSRYVVRTGIFLLSYVRLLLTGCKKALTNVLNVTIIKLGERIRKKIRKGERHGKKSCISDKLS